MLENQIASQVSSSNFRQPGHFLSQPQNPREQAKTVTLRIGKQLLEAKHKIEESKVEPKHIQKEDESPKSDDLESKQTKTPYLRFPQRMGSGALDKQFQKVLKVFKR